MKTKFALIVATFAVLAASAPMIAHHSFAAEFDGNKGIKLTGTVTKVEWMNPHTYFYIDVTESNGQTVNWGLEMGSPNGLMRAGWTRNTLKVGDEVTVEGSQAKDGTYVGNARAVVLAASGKRLFAGSSQTETPQR